MALGCCWASLIIAREHAPVALAAAATAGGHGAVARHLDQHSPLFSRRALALVLIASLHIVLIYGLASAAWHRATEQPPTTLTAEVLTAPPRTPLPPPIDVTLKSTVIEVPPIVDPPPETRVETIGATVAQPPGPPTPPITVPAVNRVLGGPGPGFPSPDDFYPPGAIRSGAQGTVAVQVCVDERGRLTAAPVIEQPSASALLDAGALRLARAGSGHYRPTTEDGRAVSACYPLRVRFQLR